MIIVFLLLLEIITEALRLRNRALLMLQEDRLKLDDLVSHGVDLSR